MESCQIRKFNLCWNSTLCQHLATEVDVDGDGAVTLDDFYNIMTKKTFA